MSVDLACVPWRVGRKVGRTIYAITNDDPHEETLIGVMDTRELAASAVRAHNACLDQEERGRL